MGHVSRVGGEMFTLFDVSSCFVCSGFCKEGHNTEGKITRRLQIKLLPRLHY